MKKFNLNLFSKYRTPLMGLTIISVIAFHWSNAYKYEFQAGEIVIKGTFSIARQLHMLNLYIFGSIGVEVFVFLSGMGLWYSFRKKEDVKEFYKKE